MKKITLLIMLLATLFTFNSCEDELNSKELYVYLRPAEDINLNPRYMADGTMTADFKEIKFPVKLTRETSVDVNIRMEVDNSLIEEYNAAHNTEFIALPEDAFTLKNVKVLIPAGEMIDTCHVELNIEKMPIGKNYIFPIVIHSVSSSDKGISISSNTRTAFVIIKMAELVYNLDTSTTPIVGTDIDRSDWVISASDVYNDKYNVEFIRDGDSSKGWRSLKNSKLSELVIDMGKEKVIKGLKILTLSKNVGGSLDYIANPKTISIRTSLDGKEWINYGVSPTLKRPTLATAEAVTNEIKFIYTKSIRYIKVVIETHNSANYGSGFAELNIVE